MIIWKGNDRVSRGRRHILCVLSVLFTFFVATVPAIAYAEGIKCYTIGTSNTPVYSTSSLTNEVDTIYASYEIILNSCNSDLSSTNVTYTPPSGRTKTGWIRSSAIVSRTSGEVHTSAYRYPTYRRPNGASYGSVYVGDRVLVLGTSGSYTQIRYPVGNGWYKIAWAYTSDVNTGKGTPASSTPMTTKVRQRLDSIANGSRKYDSRTNMKLNTKFTGTNASQQCKGFARNVFYMCFKINVGSTQSKPSNYLLCSTSGMTRVGYYSNITTNQAKSLFSKARPGDFVQMRRRSSGGSHSAIVYSVSSNGITFFEANTDGRNTVKKQYYTWSQLSSKNRGMSLYTASSYSLK